MTKIIFSLIVVFISLTSVAQNPGIKIADTPNDLTQKCQEIAAYKLYPTNNMWNFIKLDTRNGKMWVVQFAIQGDDRFSTWLNFTRLVPEEKEVNGRFILYSTQNIWNFILLDQLDGNMWQVQWSFDVKDRFVVPIEFSK